jgi:hypothetical protein
MAINVVRTRTARPRTGETSVSPFPPPRHGQRRALTLAACSTTEPSPTTTAPATTEVPPTTEATTTTTSAEEQILVKISSSDLGDILVNRSGHTLYLFTAITRASRPAGAARPGYRWRGRPSLGRALTSRCSAPFPVGMGPCRQPITAGRFYWYMNDFFPRMHEGQGQTDRWWVIDVFGNAVGM